LSDARRSWVVRGPHPQSQRQCRKARRTGLGSTDRAQRLMARREIPYRGRSDYSCAVTSPARVRPVCGLTSSPVKRRSGIIDSTRSTCRCMASLDQPLSPLACAHSSQSPQPGEPRNRDCGLSSPRVPGRPSGRPHRRASRGCWAPRGRRASPAARTRHRGDRSQARPPPGTQTGQDPHSTSPPARNQRSRPRESAHRKRRPSPSAHASALPPTHAKSVASKIGREVGNAPAVRSNATRSSPKCSLAQLLRRSRANAASHRGRTHQVGHQHRHGLYSGGAKAPIFRP
jgi:hypothetical protein